MASLASMAVSAVALAAPSLITGPILLLCGFGPLGPAARGLAALLHSIAGPNVAAGSWFAVLQSAGMGGYGAIILGTVVKLGGLGGLIMAAIKKLFRLWAYGELFVLPAFTICQDIVQEAHYSRSLK